MIDYRAKAETAVIKHLITRVYPRGYLSYVSDSFDFWGVLTKCLPALKADILARDGKLIVRPDSGDPVKIVCGDPEAAPGSPEFKGAVEVLWDLFGGTLTAKGFKLLDDHIGLIYGDSITLKRAKDILEGLKRKGFASGNVVLGIGSYTYQYLSRDSLGFAVKSTAARVDGEDIEIYKDPKTDIGGIKKSARGLLKVVDVDGVLTLFDRQPTIDSPDDCLREVFRDGELLVDETFATIRARIAATR